LVFVFGFSVERAQAFSIIDIIGGIPGAGVQNVRITADIAPNTIANTIKTALIELRATATLGQISSMNLKETVLDPIVWNMAQQMLQQITGNLLKWVNGQQPGQNGQTPFPRNYSVYYEQ